MAKFALVIAIPEYDTLQPPPKTTQDGFPLKDLDYLIQQADLSELVLLLDCCHSGNFIETRLMRDSLKTFEHKQNYYLITACRSYETAKAIKQDEHSVFSGALIEGLSVNHADSQGKVSCDRLFDYLNTAIGGKLQSPLRMGIGSSIISVKYPQLQVTEVKEVEPIRDSQGNIICPYQGLNVFTAKEKAFFFGRKRLTADIKQKLDESKFIPIIGASGSGKSSVVYAGLMGWLEEENQDWCILPTIKPGIEPLSELRRVFKDWWDEEELKEIIENEDKGIGDIVQALPNSCKYLLFIDQFEEIFTVCRSEKERKRFINLITQINGISNPYLAIITTMRADFLDRCLVYQPLYEMIQYQAIYMPPLERTELQDIIIEPAQRQGFKNEDELLQQLLEDVSKEQGFLPLLEFALMMLWEKRDEARKVLTLQAYQQLGGERSPLAPLDKEEINGVYPQESTEISENEIRSPLAPLIKGGIDETGGSSGLTQALDIYAEKVYHYRDYTQDKPRQASTEAEKQLIKLIFLRLVRTGNQEKDTRQRQPKEILLNIAGDDATQQSALNKLIDGKQGLVNARLLVTGGEGGWIDLVHEALIEGWGRFKQWREEDRDLRRLSERLEDQRREWLNHPIDDNLMMGGLLAQVRQQWERLRLYLLYPK